MFSFLLFLNEGYQVALLGIQNGKLSDYLDRPKVHKIFELMFNNKNEMPRLFLGQSFQVVLSTYMISQLTTFNRWEDDGSLISLIAKSGFCGIIVTVNCMQLLPSLIAQRYPVFFLETIPFVYSTIRIALFIETIGIVETTYLIVDVLEYLFFNRKPSLSSSMNPDDKDQIELESISLKDRLLGCFTIKTFKQAYSSILFLLSFIYLFYNIGKNNSSLNMIPPYLLVVITLLIYVMVFYCEGLKVAIVSTSRLSLEQQTSLGYDTKIKSILSVYQGDEGVGKRFFLYFKNYYKHLITAKLGKFLLGRQMIVVPLGFLMSNITLFHFENNTMPSVIYFIVVNLNIPSMLILMQLSQLTPQVLANKYIKKFLSLLGSNVLVLLALQIEIFGLTQAAYVLRSFCEKSCFLNSFKQPFSPVPDNEDIEESSAADHSMVVSKKTAIAI